MNRTRRSIGVFTYEQHPGRESMVTVVILSEAKNREVRANKDF